MPGNPKWPKKDKGRDKTSGSRFVAQNGGRGFEPPRRSGKHGALDRPPRTARAMIEREIDKDPKARTMTIFADSYAEEDIRAAVRQLNERRVEGGLSPVNKEAEDHLVATAHDVEAAGHPGAAPDVHPGGKRPFHSDEDVHIIVATDNLTPESMIRLGGLDNVVSDDFRQRFRHAIGTQGLVLHEAMHGLVPGTESGGLSGNHAAEVAADSAMVLARIASGETGMADKIQAIADWRSVSFYAGATHAYFTGTDHAQAADALLQIRHRLLTDPGGLKEELKGKSFSEIGQMAKDMAAGEHGDSLSFKSSRNALFYAQDLIKADLRIGAGDKDAQLPPVPADLDRDGAATLLRTQKALEENTRFGANNALSRAMPALRAANPDAFAHADAYVRQNYGMTPAPPPDPRAAAGRAAWEASRNAGREKPVQAPPPAAP